MQLQTLVTLACLTVAAQAAPQTFNFKDPKGVNNAIFKLDAPLEAINGSANGISGTVSFDPANPAAITGKIVVSSASLTVPNSMMQQHLHGTNWLESARFPDITFEAKKLSHVKTEGNVTTADVTGTFSLKGVSKELTVPIKLTYLKDKLGARVPNMKGDLLVIRTNFAIQRSQFNLMAGQFEDKVSDAIDLTLSIAGAAPQ